MARKTLDLVGFENILEKPKVKRKLTPETRATFIVKSDQLAKIKAISFYKGSQIKRVLEEALKAYIENYENKNGVIELQNSI